VSRKTEVRRFRPYRFATAKPSPENSPWRKTAQFEISATDRMPWLLSVIAHDCIAHDFPPLVRFQLRALILLIHVGFVRQAIGRRFDAGFFKSRLGLLELAPLPSALGPTTGPLTPLNSP